MELIDFSLVYADDAVLDDLGGARPSAVEDKLAVLLLAWRLDVDGEPIGDLIDQETAVAVVRDAARREESA